jgi:hypothetical protein
MASRYWELHMILGDGHGVTKVGLEGFAKCCFSQIDLLFSHFSFRHKSNKTHLATVLLRLFTRANPIFR